MSSTTKLSEEQLLCSICLFVFTDPVSTPCGHNFCMGCINEYWDSIQNYQCPMCKEKFCDRPYLRINTTFREVVEDFKNKKGLAKPEVPCDICTGSRDKAVKSCLVCLVSYCAAHLEPHQRVPVLKKHTLIDPYQKLEERICNKHGQLLELFCKDDNMCICQLCIETDHMSHNTVPLEVECVHHKIRLEKTHTDIQLLIKDRLNQIKKIRHTLQVGKKTIEKEIESSSEVFIALIQSVEQSQANLAKAMEEKHKEAERDAEQLIKELEKDIIQLKERDANLEQLSHSDDYVHLLQVYSSMPNIPEPKVFSEFCIKTDLCMDALWKVMAELKQSLQKEMDTLSGIQLKRIQKYKVDVTLDPNTAHPELVLSADMKQVSFGNKRQRLLNSPERFDSAVSVLAKEGYCSGRFYFEVQVKGKTEWDLGVVCETANRKGEIKLTPAHGYFTLVLRNGDEYTAAAGPSVRLTLSEKPEKVGVFVDYEEGTVSFYNVEAKSQMYLFNGFSFTEKLFPYFSPFLSDGGRNAAPLIIMNDVGTTPVLL
ncbi:zinc-binding protein A33-like [Alosa pseudoharengus]|uniref:zinc-binding protein A33-like n=1 Tax=Alosa pseudoharengus TaxID=34774 RepID=UPI003F8C4240